MIQKYDYFGLDLGDGETAAAWMRKGQNPQILEIRGRKSLISALGVGNDGKRHIGEEALQMTDIAKLHIRFKSRYLNDASAKRQMEDFARTLRESLEKEGRLPDIDRSKFFIGCPSGWDADTREDYRRLMERAGFSGGVIVSESRAALVFARESDELRINDEVLHKSALIIDAGSSTTDFSFVSELLEKPLDSGVNHLGGGLIDGLLLEYALNHHSEGSAIREIFSAYPAWRARCEMEARKVKEMYFTAQMRGNAYPVESSVKLYADPIRRLDIFCDTAIMEELLQQNLSDLNGLDYKQAYTNALREIKELLTGNKPDNILLTGGASRMPFIREIAQKEFPEANIIQGNEPEYAIARGLCYALRLEERRSSFLRDLEEIIGNNALHDVVEDALDGLFESMNPRIVDYVVEEAVPRVFDRWRSGSIITLENMVDSVSEEVAAYLASDTLKEAVRPVVAHWLNTLRPDLEDITNPVCDRYFLPRTALQLPDFVALDADIPLDSEALLGFSSIKWLLDMVIASVVAAISGGTGTALLMGGPLGLLIGFAVGLIAAWLGTEFAERLIMGRNIPLPMRKAIPRRLFTGRLNKKKPEMIGQLNAQMHAKIDEKSPDIENMADNIAQSIKTQLKGEMEKAILLIR